MTAPENTSAPADVRKLAVRVYDDAANRDERLSIYQLMERAIMADRRAARSDQGAAEAVAHTEDCAWNKTRMAVQRRCTCGALSPREPTPARPEADDERVRREAGKGCSDLLRLVLLLMSIRDYQYGFVDANVRDVINAELDKHPNDTAINAVHDVAAERCRQVETEGWASDHDDRHDRGQIAAAAACYALGRNPFEWNDAASGARGRSLWPWDLKWWKPKDRRSDLVRAGALILAEIERLDRALLRKGGEA